MRRTTRTGVKLGLALGILCGLPLAAFAQSRVPTVPFVKQALKATKGNWIAFRNYSGRQYVYFTHLLSWKCGISELHYSINGRGLEKRWEMPHCNPHVPYNIGPKTKTHLTFPLGGAKSVSIQVVFKDGSKSPVRTFGPCNVTGDTTCGIPITESDRAQEKTAGPSGGGSSARGSDGVGASGTSSTSSPQ